MHYYSSIVVAGVLSLMLLACYWISRSNILPAGSRIANSGFEKGITGLLGGKGFDWESRVEGDASNSI